MKGLGLDYNTNDFTFIRSFSIIDGRCFVVYDNPLYVCLGRWSFGELPWYAAEQPSVSCY
jgi:hypothetical protein